MNRQKKVKKGLYLCLNINARLKLYEIKDYLKRTGLIRQGGGCRPRERISSKAVLSTCIHVLSH